MNNYEVDLKKIEDERGALVPIEAQKTIPFDIKRVYYLYKLKTDLPRGFHAHKELKQFAICLKGSCDFIMDDGKIRTSHTLSQPSKGIMIDKMIWHEMHNFSEDCILMVLASDYYLESDYIRDYDDFQKRVVK